MNIHFFRLVVPVFLFICSTSNVLANEVNEWKFTVLFPMVWFTSIDGKVDIDDDSINIQKSFSDITDPLEFGYMAEFYAQKGNWLYAVKLNYMESETESITEGFNSPGLGIPIAPSHKIESERVSGITDLIVGYQVRQDTQLYTGVRTIFDKMDLTVTPQGSGIIEIDKKINLYDETLVDWLIGANYIYEFNPKWKLVLSGDIAIAGDNDKDHSFNTILAYRISKLNNLWLGYRYMRFVDSFTEGDVHIKTDFTQQGPTVGWAFTF